MIKMYYIYSWKKENSTTSTNVALECNIFPSDTVLLKIHSEKSPIDQHRLLAFVLFDMHFTPQQFFI